MQRFGEKDFKKFFEEYFITLCKFSNRYVNEHESATDIAQDAFLKTFERWQNLGDDDNKVAYLYTVARNLCLDHLKHKKAQINYLRNLSDVDFVTESFFLKEVTRQETYKILRQAIDSLPPQTRQVIMHSMNGYSVVEVSEKMNISVNSVKTLKKNAYSSLRKSISNEYAILLGVLIDIL